MSAYPETMKVAPSLALQLERWGGARHSVREREEGTLAGKLAAERVKAAMEAIRQEANAS